MTRALQRARARGEQPLDLTVSNPTLVGEWHDPEELRAILGRAAATKYEPCPAGLPSARAALAESLSTPGDRVHPDDLVLCASTSEAYSWLIRIATTAGDSIGATSPGYPLIQSLAELEQVRVTHMPLARERGRWAFQDESADRALDSGCRLLCVVHPNNPTGSYLSGTEGRNLITAAASRGTPVVSDEVFIDYALRGEAPGTMAAGAEGLVFTLGGLSKSLALPQWKLAWIRIAGDPALKAEARKSLEWMADAYLSVSTPMQAALPELLGMRRRVQALLLGRLRNNLDLVSEMLGGVSGVEILAPEGGWSVVIRVPAVDTDEGLAVRFMEDCGTLVQPGFLYDMPWDATLVISLLPRHEVMREGLRRIAAELSRLLDA